VEDLVGGASDTIVDHHSIERDTICYPVFNPQRCSGCGRCYISCMDGGHQAIVFDPETRRPKLLGKKCVGCHLCLLVCSEKAIQSSDIAVPRILSGGME
jgi:dihydropyrimidine dehydrogenase (NAD+) subunit PreA